MAVTPSNSSLLTPDDTDENQLTISKIVDPNGVTIINRITYQTSFKASGINAERNSLVFIMYGNEKLGEATSDNNGDWETLLLDAPKFDCYSVFAEGRWADTPTSPSRRFTVATDTPIIKEVLSDGKPIADDDTISTKSVTINCNAPPNQNAEALNDDTSLKTELTNACGLCTFNLEDLDPGPYNITVKGANGKVSTPFKFTVIEEGIAPVTLDKVTTATGVEVDDGTTTSETSLFVEGEGEPGAKVEVFKNRVTLDEATVDPSTGRYRHPTGELTDDTYIFTVTAKYIGGGTAGPHTITVEAIKKQVTLDKVTTANGVEIHDGTTTSETSLFVEGEGEPGAKVEVFKNRVTLDEATVDPSTGRYRHPTGDLDDGTHAFTVTAKYIGGGTAGPHTITVEAATAAPTDTRIYDAAGNVILDGGDINERWLIARGLHTPNSTVKIKLNGVIQTKTEPTSNEGKWVSFQNDLTVGQTYVISALTLDEKAESNTWSVVARSPSKS
ncbi:hypothetical protein FBY04_105180 [Pseudomonas sp. SJZ080]|uniref:hypothetical protein n=1 Tax=Pseudomonas sp. SJZ080 TaxID=2572888 RepID=UPI00119A27B0|nr:hypothetical protein [Pseudomonas sp. SJZ080]TWC57709.1 hypothetical protein FBY04_105180 [Pseudomonas sp. SJZ080]